MLHELMMALSGNFGEVFQLVNTKSQLPLPYFQPVPLSELFQLEVEIHLSYVSSSSELTCVQKISQLGLLCFQLTQISEAEGYVTSIFWNNLRLELEKVVSSYQRFLVDVEVDLCSNCSKDGGAVSLGYLLAILTPYHQLFTNLVELVRQSPSQGKHFFQFLDGQPCFGDVDGNHFFNQVKKSCRRTFSHQLVSFLTSGRCRDPFQEFFIQIHSEFQVQFTLELVPKFVGVKLLEAIKFILQFTIVCTQFPNQEQIKPIRQAFARQLQQLDLVNPTGLEVEDGFLQLERNLVRLEQGLVKDLWFQLILDTLHLDQILFQLKHKLLGGDGSRILDLIQQLQTQPNFKLTQLDYHFNQLIHRNHPSFQFQFVALENLPSNATTLANHLLQSVVPTKTLFQVNLQLDWTLHLLLDSDLKQSYLTLFAYQFQLKTLFFRCQHLTQTKLKYANSPLHRFKLVHLQVHHLLHSLLTYCYYDVIHPTYHTFLSQVVDQEGKPLTSLHQIQLEHSRVVQFLLDNCLLQGKCYQLIQELLQLVTKFIQLGSQVVKLDYWDVHLMQELTTLDQSLQLKLKFFFRTLTSLYHLPPTTPTSTQEGTHPSPTSQLKLDELSGQPIPNQLESTPSHLQLDLLLLRLDFNRWFSIHS